MYKLTSADNATVLQGKSAPGFPLIVDENEHFLEPAMLFLLNQFKNSKGNSPKTLKTYAEHLCDMFCFFISNNLDWRQLPVAPELGVLHLYRNFCVRIGNKDSTVNQKIKTAVRFYNFMLKIGRITDVPFTMIPRAVNYFDNDGNVYSREIFSPDVVAEESGDVETKYLTASEVSELLGGIKNETHFLIVVLMLATGLRLSEVCTFPLKYIFNPDGIEAQRQKGMLLKVSLSPRDMSLKRGHGGLIYISRSLMRKLYDYVIFKRRSIVDEESSGGALFLNKNSRPFTQRGVEEFVADAGLRANIGKRVHPHILRHTFATHELSSLSKVLGPDLARAWVKARLRHKSFESTQRYVHILNDETEKVFSDYQLRLDRQLC